MYHIIGTSEDECDPGMVHDFLPSKRDVELLVYR